MNDLTWACEGYDPVVIPISVTQIGLLNCDRTDCTYFLNPARSFHDPYLPQHQHLVSKTARNCPPVNTNKVHPPTAIVNRIQKGLHPIQLPHDRRTTQRHALIPPRLDLLHVQLRRVSGVQVRLTADIRLVERHKVLRLIRIHL